MDTKTTFARLVTTLAQLVTTMVTSVMTNSVLSATMSSYSDSTNHNFALSSVTQVIINQVKTPVEDVRRLALTVRVPLPDVPLVTQIIPRTFPSFGTASASTNALQALLLWRMHACLAKVPAPGVLELSTIVKLATVPRLLTQQLDWKRILGSFQTACAMLTVLSELCSVLTKLTASIASLPDVKCAQLMT
jgi:hypothetical protein